MTGDWQRVDANIVEAKANIVSAAVPVHCPTARLCSPWRFIEIYPPDALLTQGLPLRRLIADRSRGFSTADDI